MNIAKKSRLTHDYTRHIDDIPGTRSQRIQVKGEKLLVAKKKARCMFIATAAHTGINLDWQPDDFMTFDNFYLLCSTHGAQFQIEDGFCISGPCKGQELKAIPFELVDGQVVLLDQEPEST